MRTLLIAMFAARVQLVTACKPVAPADANIYIDALGFTAKTTSTFEQPTKSKGSG